MSFVSREVKPYFERSLAPLIEYLSSKGIHPNFITITGFLLIVIGSFALYYKLLLIAFLLLTVGALLDAVDGALARKMDLSSEFGAFLDSTVDRLSDAAPFFALGLLYGTEGEPYGVALSFLSMISSYSVSYTRARAEPVGVFGISGAFERAERWIVLLIGIAADLIPLALFIITVGSFATTAQRVYEVKKHLSRR